MRTAALAVVALALAACGVDIQHGLDEAEANRILVVLDRAGIPASKEREEGRRPTWKVRVASGEATRAWAVLRRHELPRGPAKGFEVFSKGGLIPTQTEERALYQQALSGEVTKMLLSYPGVIDARVLVSLPRPRSLGAQGPPLRPSASVLVKYDASVKEFSTRDVQALVAGGVPGLDLKDVTVVATPARPLADEEPAMVQVGPFVVARESGGGLRAALLVGSGAILLLAAAVILAALRLRRVRARLRELEAARGAPE